MAQADDSRDGTASRLLLDIKALSLLYPSDSGLRGVLEKSFVDYSDDDVRRLTDIIRPGRRESRVGGVLVASSEIVFASFLAILGIGSFVPNMIGVESPQQFIGYFTDRLSPAFGSGPLATSAPIIDLAFSIVLLGGALYLLRRAATELKGAGVVIQTSEK
ncbi:MAG: hypothetical protein OK441_06005 [Thaumarchaeota archaeon]|nr:hypothetical protein [Nitrososphaerota archaeon]